MRFDAVIFDLDGTLADTLEDIANAMNASLQTLGFPTHSLDAYRQIRDHARFAGRTNRPC